LEKNEEEILIMKQVLFILLVACVAVLLVSSSVSFAQEDRTGTNAASELLIPVGARYIAMSGASVANVQGVESIFWNPAGLARAKYNANAMFSHMGYLAETNINYVAVSARFGGFGTLGFSVKALDFGDIPITTELAPDGTGGQFSPQFITVGLSYSRLLSDRISVGGTVNLINEDIDRVSARGVAFDFGVQYANLANITGFNIAVSVKNIGPSMQMGGSGLLREVDSGGDRGPGKFEVVAQKDELPSVLELGASYSISLGEKSKVDLVSLFQDNNFTDDVARMGAELNYDNMFFVRGGYSFAPDAADDPLGESGYIFGPTLGAGLHYDFPKIGITFDYAFRDTEFFDSNHIFQVILGF
jgi:hypothetical protein